MSGFACALCGGSRSCFFTEVPSSSTGPVSGAPPSLVHSKSPTKMLPATTPRKRYPRSLGASLSGMHASSMQTTPRPPTPSQQKQPVTLVVDIPHLPQAQIQHTAASRSPVHINRHQFMRALSMSTRRPCRSYTWPHHVQVCRPTRSAVQ